MNTDEHGFSAEDRYRIAAGAVFKALRSQKGWSLRDFGEHVGAAHTTLYAVERGETTPGIDVMDRVATAFGLDLPALLSLIVDQLHQQQPSGSGSLAELISAFTRLAPEQRSEAVRYIEYLQYRAEVTRTD